MFLEGYLDQGLPFSDGKGLCFWGCCRFIFSTLFFSQSKRTLLHSTSLTSLKIGQASGQTLGCKREDLHMFMTFLLNWDSILQMEHLEALSCYLAVPRQK